jgi:large subunit ribosomal protein L4
MDRVGGMDRRHGKKLEMAKIQVVSLAGAKVSEIDLGELFAGDVNEALLWEAVKHYRASMRQGTAATKNRKNVSGAGKKLWKQKGTGRARVGSIRTPLWRGGGTVHGPQPRSYDYQFPKKKLMGALRSAMASKIADGKLTVVENFDVQEAKTKHFRTALNKLEAKKTTLLVESSQQLSEKLYLGSRNLAGVELVLSSEVHPYDLLKYEHAVFSQAAFEALTETLKKSISKRQSAKTTEKEAA